MFHSADGQPKPSKWPQLNPYPHSRQVITNIKPSFRTFHNCQLGTSDLLWNLNENTPLCYLSSIIIVAELVWSFWTWLRLIELHPQYSKERKIESRILLNGRKNSSDVLSSKGFIQLLGVRWEFFKAFIWNETVADKSNFKAGERSRLSQTKTDNYGLSILY